MCSQKIWMLCYSIVYLNTLEGVNFEATYFNAWYYFIIFEKVFLVGFENDTKITEVDKDTT